MTGLVEAVTAKVNESCIVSKMKKTGCKVSLKNAPEPRLIVDFDKPGSPLGKSETRCDYLFVANGERCAGWIASLELKKGSLDANEVAKQLQAGAKFAEDATKEFFSRKQNVTFRPIVALAGSTRKSQRERLKKNKVEFYGHVEVIRRMKCGASLKNVLR